ncbi:zinc finger BED domain-containing protein RICESLEEPER 2-like [Tasmannia lanceolata]|uniref:zinc finger BED domain-containing protein RICESLEEPER 2-like n=1 Tax=Tasmannia lanceolata TaxID=3420 RepID=UPI004062C181
MSRSSSSDTLPSLVVDNINNNDADIDINDEETENASVAATTSTKRSKKSQQPRSAIWTHFHRKLKPNVDDVASGGESSLYGLDICKCNYCENDCKCNSGVNGTSSLWKHLKVCKKKPQALASSGQSQLTFSMDKSGESSLTTWKFDHAAIKREMALMIMEGELPFKFVVQPRFRSLCKLLQPCFIPISRQTCRREVVNLYEGEKCKLKSYLRCSSQGICITTDTWTSNRGMSFMSITVHFVDDQWKLNKKILNFCPIIDHKGEAMGTAIEKCLKEWGIRKILTCTVDNASANDNLVRWLKNSFSSILGGEFMQMRCVAHIVNLIVCDGLKEYNVSIARIREAIKFVRGSSSRTHKFWECVQMEGIQSKNLLCLDVCTR